MITHRQVGRADDNIEDGVERAIDRQSVAAQAQNTEASILRNNKHQSAIKAAIMFRKFLH